MDVLVTGGAGFIGSHLTYRLLEEGHAVIVVDNLDPYYDVGLKRRNLEVCEAAGGDSFRFVEDSITDDTTVEAQFDATAFDGVYHEAVQLGVKTSVEDPMKSHEVIVAALLLLPRAAADAPVGRFVDASSSVCGMPGYLPYDEIHPTTPQSPYGVTKLAGEDYW